MHPKLIIATARQSQAQASPNTDSLLDEIARQGARRMLLEALKLEADDYVEQARGLRDEDGLALVVRNGKAKPRQVTVGCGTLEVEAPRVRDRREDNRFTSAILPPYLRRSPTVERLLPILYLKGLSTSDFQSALVGLLGEDATAGLSPSVIVSLKRVWEREHEEWKTRAITERFAYVFADGIHLSIRLGEDTRMCLLVLIGVAENGEKKLLAVEAGYRESADSWKAIMNSLTRRGLKAPVLAVGDGALGFWAALRECDGWRGTREQRCWVHKIANVLNDLPKRLQPMAKSKLHEIMKSATLRDAVQSKRDFVHEFHAKYPKAVEKLEKDWKELTAFFSLPALHWQSLRTTNVIESTFATVRLRTNVTKGAGSLKAAESMAFKLLQDAEKSWNRIRGFAELTNVLNGVAYVDGVMIAEAATERHSEAPVA
jgi:transposase-like protein